ncbi:MAG: asparagine synthase (glutamine-hydrolyzing) [Deltaproteobacteria bacterium]|nr:asparagine synthase (glutamine-hydrolyzing) [Deltaproteobacteria bacterium]
MCGITGIVNFREEPIEQVVQMMNDALIHRGPDAGGLCKYQSCVLGHRRLSIIDLSDSANQPMFSDDGQIAIVFNGEIYNFKELRKLLESWGEKFRTTSDTEVLLKLYINKGHNMLSLLNGMFSFAIWDNKQERLFFARDRLGKKPFYYCNQATKLSFSSELSSLLKDPATPRLIDSQALSEYFLYDFIPAPHTIFSGVKKLPPAHMGFFDKSGLRISRYWELPFPNNDLDYWRSKEFLLSILGDSIVARLISDVPLGAFLSGGIDSTLITALMSRAVTSRIRTFSVSFPGTTHDEAKWSRLAAESIGSEHTEHIVDFNLKELFPKLVSHFGEPFGDSSAIPTWRLCQETRKSVTVALSGDGGDELFGGYERYLARRYQNVYDYLPSALREKFIEPIFSRTKANTKYYGFSFTKKLKLFFDASARIRNDRLALTPQTFTRDEVRSLVGLSYNPELDPAVAEAEKWVDLDPVTAMMFTDLHTYLADDILTKVDRMSMAHALEVRNPFLDYRLVEFASGLPIGFKIRGRVTKRILKDSAKGLIPDAIIRRSKQGFQVPLGEWFKNSLKNWAEERLFTISHDYLDKQIIQKIWKDHLDSRFDNTSKIWLILFFNEWQAQFG